MVMRMDKAKLSLTQLLEIKPKLLKYLQGC